MEGRCSVGGGRGTRHYHTGPGKTIILTIFCHFSHPLLTCVELKYCRTWMKKSENCEGLQCSVHFWEEPQLLQYFSH